MQKVKSFQHNSTTINVLISTECHNITIELIRDGKHNSARMAFGATSTEPDSKAIAEMRKAGVDPTTRRVLPTIPPVGLPAEIAVQIDQISKDADAAEKLASDTKAQQLAGIDGLAELKAAISDHEREYLEFNRMMEDGDNDGARPPRAAKGDVKALRARYPRAAAYLMAESWSYASHYAKSAAGNKAMQRILNGEGHELVIHDMELAWTNHCNEHVWD